MKLLITIPNFWPHVRRGSERLVHDLGMLLVRRGHEVTVVTRTPARRSGVESLDGMRVRYRAAPGREPQDFAAMQRFALTAAVETLRWRADVYNSVYLTDAYGVSLACRFIRRPVVVSIQGTLVRTWWEENHPRTHAMFLRALELADRVTVLSEYAARLLREDYGLEPDVLRPGIFAEQWSLPRHHGAPPTIVAAGAVDDERKRTHVLLEAFARVARDTDDVRLLLIGHGRPTSSLQDVWARLPPEIAARVEHRPERTEDLPAVYAGCIAGALTSVEEAYGLVVAEYLAAGLPAVGSADTGMAEILTPGTGVLCRPGDVESCADALREVLRLAVDPATEGRCRARAAELDWSRRIEEHECLYRELCGRV